MYVLFVVPVVYDYKADDFMNLIHFARVLTPKEVEWVTEFNI